MAFGGGVELALACDFRIASSDAVFGLPEVKIGILPAGGGTTRLSRVIGLTRAMEMVMLGETIGAEEALRIGLIGRMAPPDKLREETEKIAALLSLNAPLALKMIKNTLLAGLDCSHEEGLALELKAAEFLHGTEDFREGSIAFLQKRKPVFKGC
jgi:enoyl-CoA hydratase/carnithine racemase